MRKILFGVLITLIVLFAFKYCGDRNEEQIVLKEQSNLIQEELRNVGKMIVTEGHFSEIFNYENSKEILGNYLTAEKKALVVVNANVSISYDLSQIEYLVDEQKKELTILSIPEPEIRLNPDLEYYDVQADFFNPFQARDYNEIKEAVELSLSEKIEASDLRSNAQNRLLSELSKFLILTNSMGWTLRHNENVVHSLDELLKLKL